MLMLNEEIPDERLKIQHSAFAPHAPAVKITVVTASFNGARFLTACLESVRRAARRMRNVECSMLNEKAEDGRPEIQHSKFSIQHSLRSVEHIVIDAGLTDGSVELLEQWKQGSETGWPRAPSLNTQHSTLNAQLPLRLPERARPRAMRRL